MRKVIACSLLVLVCACSGPGHPSVAQQARTIEDQVWSPYCPGRLLIDCTTEQARGLRADIERRLRRGESPEAVLRWIRLNYGEEALARPQSPWVWSFPIALLVAGGTAVGLLVRRWTKRGAPATGG